MAIPVIDFSKINGEERVKMMAQIANGCEEWGFFQLVNHGIPEELLERVKKVCCKYYKLEREEVFENSMPVKMLNNLVEAKSNEKLENFDWEDVVTLQDDINEWPSQSLEFNLISQLVFAGIDQSNLLTRSFIAQEKIRSWGRKTSLRDQVQNLPPPPPMMVNMIFHGGGFTKLSQ
ncbi:hypothetical protein NE237_018509 [Protea cynaroides]|uniref:Non-haem dioxygenase N-terminal domain-containing protein n=1 Tax=Protea cynaroides TaxID=273540 RepID=A0A9Q0QP29_9MAGN|nr:hypothetical protein NE237_018509 [Protea cynaroides]